MYKATVIGDVSTHSHPKVAGSGGAGRQRGNKVSTHSHPKVAGLFECGTVFAVSRFNTQPPEGGWPALWQ